MFTGIIEEIGVVNKIVKRSVGMQVSISCLLVLEDLSLGGSVAVNGACLTATEIGSNFFIADISPETVTVSNLGGLTSGAKVNLERAVRFDSRVEGHMVSGHIDGTGRIKRKIERSGMIRYEIFLPQELARYCIKKGSVAIDGISLTINDINGVLISLFTIPLTIKLTTLADKNPGEMVNVEVDMVAKYIEKLSN